MIEVDCGHAVLRQEAKVLVLCVLAGHVQSMCIYDCVDAFVSEETVKSDVFRFHVGKVSREVIEVVKIGPCNLISWNALVGSEQFDVMRRLQVRNDLVLLAEVRFIPE